MYRVGGTFTPSDDVESPGAPLGMAVDTIAEDSATLHFIAPGDDGIAGTATDYEIRYSVVAPLAEANSLNGTRVAEGLAPVPAGQSVSFALPGLLADTQY